MQSDRRPIKARDMSWVIALSSALAHRGVSPNTISIIGMIACLGAGACLACTPHAPVAERWLWLAAAALCQLRLMCNMLDGMVALERKVASPVGELYNEVPDRVSDIATLVGLGYAALSHPTLGWACAVLAVLTAYVRAAAKVAGAPQNYCGPMAKQHRMAVVTVVCVFMTVAPTAWQQPLAFGEHVALTVPTFGLWLIAIGCVLTILRRLRTAVQSLTCTGMQTTRKEPTS